ncbi:hypothetical protein FXV91_16110 [Methanosarcina sp. DH2]|uniref:hypothetical protein n=1 Tax=Methanosarcina sp. DH2 TaxID=2605639 RepID=UPI001E596C79|nr:hypothetical protein [Methanosarcina sp. DH2]MCC4771632.1 hypothetical protein [Methanosarcina sp. DH2]
MKRLDVFYYRTGSALYYKYGITHNGAVSTGYEYMSWVIEDFCFGKDKRINYDRIA